jgi:hypothetical protein
VVETSSISMGCEGGTWMGGAKLFSLPVHQAIDIVELLR